MPRDYWRSIVRRMLCSTMMCEFRSIGGCSVVVGMIKKPPLNIPSQGTGAVTLAALTAAIHVTKSKLAEQRIIVYGAGE